MAKLTASVMIKVDGKTVSVLTIDEGGNVEYALPKEKLREYNTLMLRNIAKADSHYHLGKGGIV